MLLSDAPLSLREAVMNEEVPLATIFRAVFDLLLGRDDVVVFGAHAVNAYAAVERMTEDVDLLSTTAAALAEEIRADLAGRLEIAVRIREVAGGMGKRVYQLRAPKNRHLVDVRQVDALPPYTDVAGIRVMAPAPLVASKLISLSAREHRPKGATDLADLRRLLLAFPELKVEGGAVSDHLAAAGATESAFAVWRSTVAAEILPDDEES